MNGYGVIVASPHRAGTTMVRWRKVACDFP
jgi:hypothetical protein